MSVFKTSLIILKIQKKEKYSLLSVFSREYGKIVLRQRSDKKQINLDLGYIINGEIITRAQETIHSFGNIHLLSTFPYLNSDPHILHEYLKLLALIYHLSYREHPIPAIYDMVDHIHQFPPSKVEKMILLELYLLHILGILEHEGPSERIKKIILYIAHHSFESCLKLKGFQEDELIYFQKLIDRHLKR